MQERLIIPHIPFYFVRHGETERNRLRLVMGSQDTPLNQTGIAQAIQVGTLLRTLPITKIVASPLMRAQQTAELINQHLNVHLDFHPGIRECRWGVLESGAYNHPGFADWAKGITPEGGEGFDEFHVRVASAFANILEPEQNTLIVSHGVVYRGLLRVLNAQATDQKAGNCVVYLFSPPDSNTDRWMVYALNDEE